MRTQVAFAALLFAACSAEKLYIGEGPVASNTAGAGNGGGAGTSASESNGGHSLASNAGTSSVVAGRSNQGANGGQETAPNEGGASGEESGGGTTPASGSGGSAPVAGDGGSGQVAGNSGTGGSVPSPLGSVRVSADGLDRDHTIVTFPLPDLLGRNLVLRDTGGTPIPLQVSEADGNASFILAALPAGATATFTIEELSTPLPDAITTSVATDGQLDVKLGAATMFRWILVADDFLVSNEVRAGYIYPLYTPDRANVTDDFPTDHPQQHGIWSAWSQTTFRGGSVDFWNSYLNEGRVDLSVMDGAWSGSVHAGFVARIDHKVINVTPNVIALNEKWVVTAYKTHDAAPPYYVFDIDSVQELATSDPLILEQYPYGGFGFRGSLEWMDSNNVQVLTSEGLDRASADASRARWCAQYGTVYGKPAGYAGFSHPTNLRHPQGLRVHPADPYWSFTPITPQSGGRFSIEVGAPLVSRYRVVAFDGDADATLLDRLWDDYASPPTVTRLP